MPNAFLTADAADGHDSDTGGAVWRSVLADAASRYRDSTSADGLLGETTTPLPEAGYGSEPDAEALLHRVVRFRAEGGAAAVTTESVLADALALAVGMARESARRERWALAAASAITGVLSGNGQRPLEHVARHAARAACADYGTLTLLVAPGLLAVRAAWGAVEPTLVGTCPDTAGSVAGRVIGSGKPLLAGEYPDARTLGPVAAVPVLRHDRVIGALVVGRAEGGRPFTPADLDELGHFATHAAPALEAVGSGALRRGTAERGTEEAIAEAADHVIGDLFTVGLGLQGIIATTASPVQRERLTRYLDSTSAIITRVRELLSTGPASRTHPVPLSLRLLSTVDAGELTTGLHIRASIEGNVNSAPGHLADEVVTVVRDALATVSHAQSVKLTVNYGAGGFTVVVADDGLATLGRSRLVTRLRECAENPRAARQDRCAEGRNRLTWTTRSPW